MNARPLSTSASSQLSIWLSLSFHSPLFLSSSPPLFHSTLHSPPSARNTGSYGSTKRYKSFPRLTKANETTLVGAGGELSDFQYLQDLLDELNADDFCADDGLRRTPASLCSYLTRVLYNRRSKFDPLWNSLVVGGVDPADGTPFLGAVSMLGVKYEDGHVATGFGAHLARPLFREKHSKSMSRADAEALLREALAVCYYRDKQSINKFQIAVSTKEGGVQVGEPFALATEWGYGAFVHPSAHAVGTW
jgi:20S proteasome subunit beta 7